MTKPESQYTVMETIFSIIFMTEAGGFGPTARETRFAIVLAAALLARTTPIMVPRRMTMPIARMELPKPVVIVLITSAGAMPAQRPKPKAMMSKERKAWILRRAMKRMSSNMDMVSRTSNMGHSTIKHSLVRKEKER